MKYNEEAFYKKALLSPYINPRDMMKDITIPDSVFKYRSFGSYNDNIWTENPYWRESLRGEVFFATPKSFNSNDPIDCRLSIDFVQLAKRVMDKDISNNPEAIKQAENIFEQYIDALQTNKRIGCFTTVDCTNREMWDDPYFGKNGEGYCIEYRTEKELFYPENIAFLKVVYDDNEYDATELMVQLKNFENSEIARVKTVCLRYNPFLFKKKKFEKECEWRIIIPENRYESYFGAENTYIKNMSSLVKAIYLGPNYRNIPQWNKKRDEALVIAKKMGAKVFEVLESNLQKYELVEITV